MAPPSVLDLTSKGTTLTRSDPQRRAQAGGPPPRPPRGEGGGGDGGGGGEGSSGTRDPDGTGRFALALALLGITTLFAVLIAVALLTRRPAPDWPARAPLALVWLAASSTCLVLASLAIERAARRARAGPAARPSVRRALAASLVFGAAFVAAQASLWLSWWRAGNAPSTSGYAATFFALTSLHALHVLGGLAFLLGLLVRAAGALPAASVRLGALYWHFMGALWVVLVVVFVLVP